MKKIIVLSLGLFAATQVLAQTAVCANGTASNSGIYDTTNTATNPAFVVRSFTTRCSANVTATARETAVAFGVGALSTKGKSYFQGTTGGGAISATACGTTCTAGQEDTNLNNLVNSAT